MEPSIPLARPESEAKEHDGGAWNTPCLRIGHGGAAGHAPANTLRSLTLALEMGVDMVEFDVRPCRDDLVLLHDDSLWAFGHPQRLASESTLAELRSLDTDPDAFIPTLAEALDLLNGRVLVNVDLKATGYEDAVLNHVIERGMTGDVIYSSLYPDSLRRVRQLAPSAMTGLSYPEDRGNASSKSYLQPIVASVLALMRFFLPYRVLSMMEKAQANAVMLYQKVVSRPVVETVQQSGGKVFVWTVDELERMRQIYGLGVDGITTNHPELFSDLNDT